MIVHTLINGCSRGEIVVNNNHAIFSDEAPMSPTSQVKEVINGIVDGVIAQKEDGGESEVKENIEASAGKFKSLIWVVIIILQKVKKS